MTNQYNIYVFLVLNFQCIFVTSKVIAMSKKIDLESVGTVC